MKTLFTILILVCTSAFAGTPKAQTNSQNKKDPVKVSQGTSNLSTDVKFDGHTVGGKIQTPMEALTVVENEKEIDDLIGVRKNFDDRKARAKGLR